MRAIRLTAANVDLIRQLDGDQDGWIHPADLERIEWIPAIARLFIPDAVRRLERLSRRPNGRLPIALGRRRLQSVRDWTWAARRLKDAMAAVRGLPPVLLETPTALVGHGDDPGKYYCEHLFYTLLESADRADSSILTNEYGEKLVGFLHVPADPYCRGKQPAPADDSRHTDTRRVVAAALRGYLMPLLNRPHETELRVLITGFDAFRRITDNPTGAFVGDKENLNAAMTLAIGDQLAAVTAPETAPTGGTVHGYELRPAGSTAPVTVRLLAQRLPVADEPLQANGNASIHATLATFQPHAVLAMGVASNARRGDYRVEHHADDANWRDGRHVVRMAPTHSLPANFALARAILHGGRR